MLSKRIKNLHSTQTQTSQGDVIIVDDVTTLIIAVSGTSTSFTLGFLSSLDGVNYFPLSGNKMSDYSTFATSTTETGQAWQFDVTGLCYFKANLSSISNGNISVLAKAFESEVNKYE